MAIFFYQIGILITIQISAFFGKYARNVAIVLISIFTILQVFTSGLMILQFITIFISYIMSEGIIDGNKKHEAEKNLSAEYIGRAFGDSPKGKVSSSYYGVDISNPILMSSVPSSYRFLNQIIEDNPCLYFNRAGSTRHENFPHPIDIYNFFKDENLIAEIYIYPYYNSNVELVPEIFKNYC